MAGGTPILPNSMSLKAMHSVEIDKGMDFHKISESAQASELNPFGSYNASYTRELNPQVPSKCRSFLFIGNDLCHRKNK